MYDVSCLKLSHPRRMALVSANVKKPVCNTLPADGIFVME